MSKILNAKDFTAGSYYKQHPSRSQVQHLEDIITINATYLID